MVSELRPGSGDAGPARELSFRSGDPSCAGPPTTKKPEALVTKVLAEGASSSAAASPLTGRYIAPQRSTPPPDTSEAFARQVTSQTLSPKELQLLLREYFTTFDGTVFPQALFNTLMAALVGSNFGKSNRKTTIMFALTEWGRFHPEEAYHQLSLYRKQLGFFSSTTVLTSLQASTSRFPKGALAPALSHTITQDLKDFSRAMARDIASASNPSSTLLVKLITEYFELFATRETPDDLFLTLMEQVIRTSMPKARQKLYLISLLKALATRHPHIAYLKLRPYNHLISQETTLEILLLCFTSLFPGRFENPALKEHLKDLSAQELDFLLLPKNFKNSPSPQALSISSLYLGQGTCTGVSLSLLLNEEEEMAMHVEKGRRLQAEYVFSSNQHFKTPGPLAFGARVIQDGSFVRLRDLFVRVYGGEEWDEGIRLKDRKFQQLLGNLYHSFGTKTIDLFHPQGSKEDQNYQKALRANKEGAPLLHLLSQKGKKNSAIFHDISQLWECCSSESPLKHFLIEFHRHMFYFSLFLPRLIDINNSDGTFPIVHTFETPEEAIVTLLLRLLVNYGDTPFPYLNIFAFEG